MNCQKILNNIYNILLLYLKNYIYFLNIKIYLIFIMEKLNIFLFHRDLRLEDNTALIEQIINEKNITPIFIFTPEQINSKINKYFSNASVQFMVESLYELYNDIKEKNGKFYFYKGDTMKVNSIGYNIDYTPYAKKRDLQIKEWCKLKNIILYEKEDYVLYDILNDQTLKKNKTPYLVFTPFKNYCMKNLKVREINKFKNFKFKKSSDMEDIKYYINIKKLDDFYIFNSEINVNGGRSNGLKILNSLEKFKDYLKKRDFLIYNTTFLGAHNHFSTVSIREVYYHMINTLGKNSGLINEIHWRDFYINITHFFPHILQGQLNGNNKSFKKAYDNIKWSYDSIKFEKFKNGQTGFPIIDAGIAQLLKHNFVHNRIRMLHGNFLTKDLHIDWKSGEQFYSNNLVDIDAMVNNNSWQWCSGSGTDAQPYFRIFNPWIQTKKYDPDLKYIRKYLPELNNVPDYDIFNWWKPEIHEKWLNNNIKYYKPILDHSIESKIAIKKYKEI